MYRNHLSDNFQSFEIHSRIWLDVRDYRNFVMNMILIYLSINIFYQGGNNCIHFFSDMFLNLQRYIWVEVDYYLILVKFHIS